MNPACVIHIESLRNRHPNGFLLDIEDLAFDAGGTYALVGPNGSGKTTLLSAVAGLTVPDAGHVYFHGELLNGSTPLETRRKIVLLSQDPYLFKTTVLANVAYGPKLRGLGRREGETKARAALQTVGLERLAARDARDLSGGEMQLVALARAIAVEPELLLLDEPTANLDRENTAVIENLIGRLDADRTKTVIFTTHHIEQAHRLADEVVLLIDGRPVERKPDNIFTGHAFEASGSTRISIARAVTVSAITEKRGDVRILIDPEDIILSTLPLDASARNSFKGTITRTERDGQRVRVFLEVAGHDPGDDGEPERIEFVALISRKSYADMHLNPGRRLYLTFKSSSVQVFQ